LLRVPEVGVPKIGVTRVGDVAKTRDPDPVSSVTAAAKFEELGVAKNVAILLPRPDTPVEIGRPVQFVRVPEVGVPKIGVTKLGVLAKTKAPVPVSSVTAEIKFAELGVAKNVATPVPRPDTPVEMGKPVQLVNVPEEGVPRAPPFTTNAPAVPTFTSNAAATPVPKLPPSVYAERPAG
jgi:hypothetical protein